MGCDAERKKKQITLRRISHSLSSHYLASQRVGTALDARMRLGNPIDLHEKRYYWEVKSSSASLEIPRTVWNLEVHHPFRESLPPQPIRCHINPIHSLPSNFFTNPLIVSSHVRLQLPPCLFCQFPHHNSVCISHLHYTCPMSLPYEYPPTVHLPNNIWWGVQNI